MSSCRFLPSPAKLTSSQPERSRSCVCAGRRRRQVLHLIGLVLLEGRLLTLADLRHELTARLGVFLVVDRLAGERLDETIERHGEADGLSARVHGDDHDAAARLHLLDDLGGRLDLGRAAGGVTQRVLERDRLQRLLVDLLVLGSLGPLLLGVDRGAQAGWQRHAERHHHHHALLVVAFDLADRGRHHDHARVAIEALMMREADVLLVLDLFAVLVLRVERRLLAELDPRALLFGGSAGLGGGSAGRSLRSRSGGGSLGCRSGRGRILRRCRRTSDEGGHPDGGAHGRDPAGAPPLVQEVRNVICHEYKPFLESWSVQLTPRRASMNCAPI